VFTHAGNRVYIKIASTVAGTAPNVGGRSTLVEIDRHPGNGTTDGQWDLGGGVTVSATTSPGSVDLRAYTPQDGTSLTLVDIDTLAFTCPSTNTAKVTVSVGASNGFTGVLTSGGIDVYPGGSVTWQAPASSVSTDATHKTLDYVAASGTQSLTVTAFGRSA
jgi:hypothetical protein